MIINNLNLNTKTFNKYFNIKICVLIANLDWDYHKSSF